MPAAELYRLSDTVEFPDSQRQRTLARSVTSYSFNRAACTALATELSPNGPGKTLIFCVDGQHADTVAGLLEDALRNQHGTRAQGSVLTITGAATDRQSRLQRFRSRKDAAIAVTDDFLAAGEAALEGGKADNSHRQRISELEKQVGDRDQVIGELTIANRILKKLSGESP